MGQADATPAEGRGASVVGWLGLVALVVAGFALRLREAWQDLPDLVVNTLPDDSFYYFQIARNIAHGEGATLDGETVTSGFHPLWLALITPLFAIDNRVDSVHAALTLGAVLGAATIALTFAIVLRLTGNQWAALMGAGFFALHPVIVTYAVNGLETSIALFTMALTCWLFVRMAYGPSAELTPKQFAVLGVAAALMVLARTDTALVAAAVLGWFLLRPGALRLRGPVIAAGLAGLVLLPWPAWCFIATGSPVQDSAVAGGLLQRKTYFATHEDTLSNRLEQGWDVTWKNFTDKLPHEFMVPLLDDTRVFWAAAAVLVLAVLVIPTTRRRDTLVAAGIIMVPFVGLLSALLYESAVRWFVRSWYYAPYALLAAVFAGLVASWAEGLVDDVRERLVARRERPAAAWHRLLPRPVAVGCVYLIMTLALLRLYGPQRDEIVFRYFWQTAVLEASEYLRDETEPDTRVAAYNAGIPSYLSERTVVNLDGVVNRDAYEAASDCRTRDYLREKRIDIVAEVRGQFLFAHCGLTWDVDVEIITQVGGPDPVYILKPRSTQDP